MPSPTSTAIRSPQQGAIPGRSLRPAAGNPRLHLKGVAPTTQRPRIALYSHDTMGLGHLRRNLLVAHAIASSALSPVLLTIVGKPESRAFPLPPQSDRLILPAFTKRLDGNYEPRSLGVPLRDFVALRASILRAALDAFHPDLLIVDNVPRGALGELDGALASCSRAGTRVVLGMRDILDDPATVAREWETGRVFETLRTCYDQIWIYGDPAVYDPLREYGFPSDIARRCRYTGYFDHHARIELTATDERRTLADAGLLGKRFVLCLLGGGQDGGALADAFAAVRIPQGLHAAIVAGPYLPEDHLLRLRRRAARDPRFHLCELGIEPTVLVSHAEAVVAMGGYNTVWEIVSSGKPALLVPRVRPRLEQWIRAERLRELGLVDVLAPDLLTSKALTRWLRERAPLRPAAASFAFDGLTALPRLAAALLAHPTPTHRPAAMPTLAAVSA